MQVRSQRYTPNPQKKQRIMIRTEQQEHPRLHRRGHSFPVIYRIQTWVLHVFWDRTFPGVGIPYLQQRVLIGFWDSGCFWACCQGFPASATNGPKCTFKTSRNATPISSNLLFSMPNLSQRPEPPRRTCKPLLHVAVGG